MADTLQQIIQDVQRTYPKCDQNRAIRLAGWVHDRLCLEMPLFVEVQATALVASQAAYAPPTNWIKIRFAGISSSSNTSIETYLVETSRAQLERENPSYIHGAEGTPSQFYMWQDSTGVMKVHLAPVPSTTLSGSYLVISAQTRPALASLSDTISPALLNSSIYSIGICMLYAKEADKDNYQGYAMDFQNELSLVKAYMAHRGPFQSNAYPSGMYHRRQTI